MKVLLRLVELVLLSLTPIDEFVSTYTVRLAKTPEVPNSIQYLVEFKLSNNSEETVLVRAVQESTKPYETMIKSKTCSLGLLTSEKNNYDKLSNSNKQIVLSVDTNVCRAVVIFLLARLLYLNPVTKEIIPRYSTNTSEITNSISSRNVSPIESVKYIRKIQLTHGLLDDYSTKLKQSKHYHKDAWYVLGHYRHYKKSDKTILVDGYWKGKLRDNHNSSIRKRLLNTDNHREYISLFVGVIYHD